MRRSAVWRIGAITALALMMTGCGAGTPQAYTELSAKQTSSDHLPDGYAHQDGIDADSVRLVGTHEANDYFLARFSDTDTKNGLCILIVPVEAPKDGYRACSGGTGELTAHMQGQRGVRYLPPGTPEIEGHDDWIRLSDNLVLMS